MLTHTRTLHTLTLLCAVAGAGGSTTASAASTFQVEEATDQVDREMKTVLRDRLGAELVESIDPGYPDDPDVPNMRFTFPTPWRNRCHA